MLLGGEAQMGSELSTTRAISIKVEHRSDKAEAEERYLDCLPITAISSIVERQSYTLMTKGQNLYSPP